MTRIRSVNELIVQIGRVPYLNTSDRDDYFIQSNYNTPPGHIGPAFSS